MLPNGKSFGHASDRQVQASARVVVTHMSKSWKRSKGNDDGEAAEKKKYPVVRCVQNLRVGACAGLQIRQLSAHTGDARTDQGIGR
jgi:hypothetical protein